MDQVPGRDHIPGTIAPTPRAGEPKHRMGEGQDLDPSARKEGQSQHARKGDTGANATANVGKSDHKCEDRIDLRSKYDADRNAQKQNQPQPKTADLKPKH